MAGPTKRAMPARSNKGGATRGKARAAQVQAMNAQRKPRPARPGASAKTPRPSKPSAAGTPLTLPKVNLNLGKPPNLTRVVPQVNLFGAIGDRLKQVTTP